MTVRLDALGHIRAGRDRHSYVLVQSPRVNGTSGYQILVASRRNMDGPDGWDAWVELQEDIDTFFLESGWEVDWLEEEGTRG